MKKSIQTAIVLLLASVSALHAQSLSEQLDAIDLSMAETGKALARSEATLETVRQTLYDQALRAREVKLTAEAMRPLRDDPQSGEAVEKLLNQVRSYMALSSQELRSNRDRLDMLDKMFREAQAKLGGVEKQLADVRGGAGTALEADRNLTAMQSQLGEARATIDNAKKALAARDQTIAEMKKENQTLREAMEKMQARRTVEIRAELAKDHLSAGYDALSAGRFDEASFSFRNELIRSPESVEARVGLAACLFETGELANARTLVDEALSADKRNASALGLRGALLFREGYAEDARTDLERAVRLDDENSYNHNYLGVVYQGLGLTKNAIKQISRSVELAPGYASGHYNLAILFLTSEEPDAAAAGFHYDQFLQLGGAPNPDLEQLLALTQAEAQVPVEE